MVERRKINLGNKIDLLIQALRMDEAQAFRDIAKDAEADLKSLIWHGEWCFEERTQALIEIRDYIRYKFPKTALIPLYTAAPALKIAIESLPQEPES